MQGTGTSTGWVKSIDPNTGRTFYANHITRKTQWDPPVGWIDYDGDTNNGMINHNHNSTVKSSNNDHSYNDNSNEQQPLPSNWEMMHDPTTGKPFYIDHVNKVTQWTRPTATTSNSSSSSSSVVQTGTPFQMTNSTNSSSNNRSNNTNYSNNSSTRIATSSSDYNYFDYATTSAYSSKNHQQHNVVDFSDTMPSIDFKVGVVSDILRPNCSNCHTPFSMSKRRHHCRLCGDIFCDTCSTHRATLPFYGSEYDKPVRICDYCNIDVTQHENFFSMRRYLTVLHLYNPTSSSSIDEDTDSNTNDKTNVATPQNVNAALSALTQDLDQMVTNATQLQLEKITIPPNILIPVIIKHLHRTDTVDRAIRCITSLLAVENLAGTTDYATAIYIYGKKMTIDVILSILERNGTDRKTLFVQEQAARTIYYLTESKLIGAVTRKYSELTSSSSDNDDSNYSDTFGTVEDSLDIPRAIRNLLDHASGSSSSSSSSYGTSSVGNPNLQRWSAATLKNLILEDQRQACYAINEMAALVASGESISTNNELQYKSHLPELVSTGGVMILGSLIGSDDSDTRANAITALGCTIQSTRAVNAALQSLSEMSGGEYGGNGAMTTKDGDIVRAIVAAGGCAGSVAQLLLSAEHSVAGMGCQFLLSLVRPLLTDSSSTSEPITSQYEYNRDMSNMGAYRSASIEIATGSCLPALLSLVRLQPNGKGKRPIELSWIAMETITATILSIGEIGRAWAAGQYEEGLERYGAPSKLKEAIIAINEEDILEFCLQILQSNTLGQSLGGSATSQETPAMRIRECAGIILSSITSCSAEAITNLQSRNVLASLLLASTDGMMTLPSTIRLDGSPRCLGILETVALILMFSWQHPSGSEKDLLDALIEMIDSGAIPYLSKVLRNKVEWESKDKAIGGMKARIACCRFLCCLFGIALNDATGIGMRRLMDAVESDASTYRVNNDRRGQTSSSGRVPTNIVELTLGTLQNASNLARLALLGGAAANQQGPLYHSTVMDLVEASLLAVGSMCGSSIAPGGSEGTLITGESFLESRSDSYITRRQEICNVACDVVVRGGRGEPTLLPTMVVGGFGEGSVLASIRLALAIAQNGTKEQHTKLASSGILVPVSDLLRSALSRGDIYKFSSSLALVRFCGPYVAAGQAGGVEPVREAIRVATNVLTLPVNPGATQKQMDTQETLKAECIAALEALSRNASLWSSISTEALPAVIQYIHSSARNSSGHDTKCAALRAILQIVQVPSHAISAAEAGIVGPLGQLLSSSDEYDIILLTLEVLHVIATNQQARMKSGFLSSLRSICFVVGQAAFEEETSDKSGYVAYLGLEIIHSILGDIEGQESTGILLQSPTIAIFLATLVSEPKLIQSLCATLLVRTQMMLPRHEADNTGSGTFEIPKLYGPPLALLDENCAGFANNREAGESLLFSTALYACALETQTNESFWSVVLFHNSSGMVDKTEQLRASLTFVAHFLSLLTKEHKPFMPQNPRRQEDFLTISRPLVCHRLLEALRDLMNDLSSITDQMQNTDPYLTSVLVAFNVPHICLSLWKDPALLEPAFELIKLMVEQDPDEILHLFVEGKEAIMSLFDLLCLDSNFDANSNVAEIRRFLAFVLGQLSETGLLASAAKRFDVRSSAIAALATACLTEEQRAHDDDDDMTSNQLSSVLMKCLVELCTITDEGTKIKKMRLAPAEATAIATNLGKKLCHMVLSRFLERTKLKQYEMDEDENILDAPDVAMLVCVAQHEDALKILRSIGGLHAVSLIAAEGDVTALVALKKACNGDADILLEGDTYISLVNLVSSQGHGDSATWRELETSAFDLLANLCVASLKGRNAVATTSSISNCVQRANDIVAALFSTPKPMQGDLYASDVSDDDVDDGEETSRKNEPDISVTAAVTHVEPITVSNELSLKAGLEIEDIALAVAACSFLSSLAAVKMVHSTLRNDSDIVAALSYLAKSSSNESLQFAAINLVVSLAPFVATGTCLDAHKVGQILASVVGSKNKITRINQVQHTAVCGLSVVFDLLDNEVQENISKSIAVLFTQSVKSCIVVRSVTKNDDNTYAVELSYALTSILLSFRGKFFNKDVFSSDIITSLLCLVQWKYDPKTVLLNTEARTWSASVSNCLLLLSSILWRTDEELNATKVNLQSLANNTLMLARPGKAPRKAIDVKSALQCAIEGTDSATAIAAQRVLCRLFN